MPLLLVKPVLANPVIPAAGDASSAVVLMPPCGINPDPEWALDRAGLPREDGPAYSYPDTQTPVRLYLIDSSVANPGDWIGANCNLTLEKTELVRGVNDPETFSTDHGTKMLSLIGDIETGIAPGTPVHVVNYDVFPSSEGTNLTTTTSLLIGAVQKAITDARTNPVPMRSVISIGTTSATITSSGFLKSLINQAVTEGIVVVVPAGNWSVEIPDSDESYIPAAYGIQNGVICVGASCAQDTLISVSNFGTPVDLLAPGDAVRVRTDNEAIPFATVTGTSPATALVAGAALIELSLDPTLTPAQVEERLKVAAITPPVPTPLPVLRATAAATQAIDIAAGILISPDHPAFLGDDAVWFENFIGTLGQDLNNNGLPDILEEFYGFNAQYLPTSPTLTPASGPMAEYKFPISKDLLDEASPFKLRNGNLWRIQCSGNMVDWNVPEGSLTQETDEDGRIWLTATFQAPPTACFVRIQLVAPPTD
jgi:hypothetical protein